MSNSDSNATSVSAEEEDRALFKTYGGPIEVEMVPRLSRPNRHLFLAKAFFEGTREIVVVISGRRAQETKTLETYLKKIESSALQRAVARRAPPPETDKIRLPLQIKGSWEIKLQSEPDSEDIKILQLIAARWAFTDSGGQLHQFGESPAFDSTTRRRNKSYILQSREIDALPRAPKFGGSEE